MAFTTIAVLGLGNVGHLAAELLTNAGFEVTGFDSRPISDAPFSVRRADLADAAALLTALDGQEAVLSCLPYAFNEAVASAAHALGAHYFDLTEDVATSRHICALAESAKGVMAPQCGLAPGFVAIVGAYLAISSNACARSASGSARCRSIPPACSAMPSTGRPKASSTNISTIAR